MMHTLALAVAWVKSRRVGEARTGPVMLTYNLSDDFCDRIQPRFLEDIVFSWHMLGCTDVSMLVRQGFDAWEHNSFVSFLQTNGSADIIVDASMSQDDDALGWAVVGAHATTIDMSRNFCWYTDRAFCDSVREWYVPLLVLMGTSWSISLVTILYVCRNRASTAFDAISRIVAWTVLLSHPLVLVTVLPCVVCYDFLTVLMHEVGHGLGLLHSDDATATNICGCRNVTRPCASSHQNVMHSTFRHRPSACLSRDDVDGVRTMWGGDCLDPVWCYTSPSLSGFSRLHTSLVYSFAIAWTVVFLRNLYSRWHRDRVERRLTPGRGERARVSSVSKVDPTQTPQSRLRVVDTSRGSILVSRLEGGRGS